MEIVNKFTAFIRKDTGNENESIKLSLVDRYLLLFMFIYFIFLIIFDAVLLQGLGIGLLLVGVVITGVIFAWSYFISAHKITILINVWILIYVFCSVKAFGWGVCVQLFIPVLIVLTFFSVYKNYGWLILYAAALVAFRMSCYMYSTSHVCTYTLSASGGIIMQVINSFFAYACISCIALIFSRDSQSLEGKLMDYNVQLVNQANTDALTGLNNRRKTKEFLESHINEETKESVCVCIADIDFFKNVNDSYGHDIGDKVLKTLANTMVKKLPDNCFVSRWGGEEFLIVFTECNGDEALSILQELRFDISKINFEVGERSFKVTLTYGLAEYDYKSDIDTMIKEADEKLYSGKNNGRDQIVY